MKLLADENFPAPVIAALRAMGHDVSAIAESMPGATDIKVLDIAASEERILITLDRDYGDLIFHEHRLTPPGVVLFRLSGSAPKDDNERIVQVLSGPDRWVGRFTTVTDTLMRSRPFPR